MDQQAFTEWLDKFLSRASVKAAFGQPEQVGEKTLIPVAQVVMGYGAGSGRGPARPPERGAPAPEAGAPPPPPIEASGAGAGGGLRVKPLAVVEVTATETKVRSISDSTTVAVTAFLVGAWNVFWIAMTLRAIFGKRRWESKR